jgi:hypothetical protein
MVQTITLTFGDAGENHVGMEMIGEKGNIGDGFNKKDLENIIKRMNLLGLNKQIELYYINELLDEEKRKNTEEAYVLVLRNTLKTNLLRETEFEELKKEMNSFEWDSQYFDRRRKKVLNKHARYNVCFNEESKDPDYENGKGRIIGFQDLKIMNRLKENLKLLVGEKMDGMICEGNKYFDVSKCGIGWHGDAERRKVIGCRIGEEMKLCYNWFIRSKPVGEKLEITLNDGDIYFMSEKAVGTDWMKKSIYTLRHSAGCDKYTTLKKFESKV